MKSTSKWIAMFAIVIAFLPASVSLGEKSKKTCKCPVAGKELTIGAEHSSTTYKEATVYFCCDGCKGKFEADNGKYAAKANMQLVVTGQAKQVMCPIAGRKVSKSQTVSIDKLKVAFCCGNCKGKAEKAEGDEKLAMIFGDKAFAKGFKVVKK